jgi:hydroxyacylglutathione hydrolase
MSRGPARRRSSFGAADGVEAGAAGEVAPGRQVQGCGGVGGDEVDDGVRRDGSFCSAVPDAVRTTTISAEKAANPQLAAKDADTFVARLLEPLGSYPAYFHRLGELNRRGPAIVDGIPQLTGLGRKGAPPRRRRGDDRGRAPGRRRRDRTPVAIPLQAQFPTWLGWLIPAGAPTVIVRSPYQDPADILWPALNIGIDNIAGELAGGIEAWTAASGDVVRPAGRTRPGGRHRNGHPAGA